MPNPNTLPWLHYQDIQIPDVTLRQQFRQYVQTTQYSEALALLTNNAQQLQGKAYIADVINTIISGVVNLEERYDEGVTQYLGNLTSQYTNLINNFRKRSTWQSTVQYTPYNFVVYNQQIYMCINTPPIGTLPTTTQYWLYLGLQGAQGVPGINVNITFDWDDSTPYQPNDLAVYQGNIYCAKIANTNVVPTDTNTWGVFLVLGEGKINVGLTAPTNPTRDMIWFQTAVDPDLATTSDPLIGTFKRYNLVEQDWEDMYPNVLFTWIDGTEDYAPMKIEEDITIGFGSWQNNQWTYTNASIDSNASVEIWPNGLNEEQYNLYSNISLQINSGSITLTAAITPTVNLPIIITIQ